MMLLKNILDIDRLLDAVNKCKGDVVIRSIDGSEEFNLKSAFSKYLAIGRLADECGDEYEMFCLDKDDECNMLQFFQEINKK
ncbi:MAG: hypothetical protein VB055_07545 [Oscillospiraceae bacterium]|nr:hypothetical protein [Oscillospiraceae bacterium]